MKTFVDDKLDLSRMTGFNLKGVENYHGKKEKCCKAAFSYFTTMISKASLPKLPAFFSFPHNVSKSLSTQVFQLIDKEITFLSVLRSDSDVPLSSMKMQTVPESVVSYQENESTNTHGLENKPEEKNEENLIESDIDEDQSSKPLLFLSSSDDSDNEKGYYYWFSF